MEVSSYLNTFAIISVNKDLNLSKIGYEYYNENYNENDKLDYKLDYKSETNLINFNNSSNIKTSKVKLKNSYWILIENEKLIPHISPFLSEEETKKLFAGPFASLDMMEFYLKNI